MEISQLVNEEDIVLPPIGYVYACKSEAFPNRIKIGKCNDVGKRLSALNTGCAPSPHILITASASFDNLRDERMAHAYFAGVRREGEFFETSEEAVKAYFQMHIVAQHRAELEYLLTSQWNYPTANCAPCQFILTESQIKLPYDMSQIVKDKHTSSFLSALINQNLRSSYTYHGRDFFQKYLHFCGKWPNSESPMSMTAFGMALRDLKGISKKRSNAGAVYTICIHELKTHLESCGRYVKDAKFDFQ
jgi:hypothetical protein